MQVAEVTFVAPYTIGGIILRQKTGRSNPESADFKETEKSVNDDVKKLLR